MAKTKKVQKQTGSDQRIERPLTIAGLGVVLIGSFSSIFYAHANRTFIEQSFVDSIYYLSYLILLGGGFAIGFAFTHHGRHRLFSGVVYALLASVFYFVVNYVRFTFEIISNGPHYPLSNILFQYSALITLFVTFVIAVYSQLKRRDSHIGTPTKKAFLFAIAFTTVFPFLQELYIRIYIPQTIVHGGAVVPGIIALHIITSAVIVTAVAYLLYGNIAHKFERLFYAALTGSFAYTVIHFSWNFRSDASEAFTTRFESATLICTLLIIGLILWRARKAIATS